MSKTRADILEAAATALLIPGAWTQGSLARNASGHKITSTRSDACQFCAMGAIYAVDSSFRQDGALLALQDKVGGDIPSWNDEKGQTAENVAKTMFEVAQELRAR